MTWTVVEKAQRAVVLQLLRDDHPTPWTRAELERELSDIEPLAVNDALAVLDNEDVVILDGEQVQVSRCARHLDALGLVAI